MPLLAQVFDLDVTFVVIRALHIGAAAVAIGAAVFQFWSLLPVLRSLEPEPRLALRERLVDRWRPVAFTLVGVLLLTGMLNYILYKIPEYRGNPRAGLYHGLLGIKILLALGVFHFATVLALPGARGAKWRDKAGRWLPLMLTFMAAIVVLGAVLRGFQTKAP